jgi:PAS domain S-box-containing protein
MAARQSADTSFLEGGGELGALMRAYDWSRTPLGAPAGWPRSLKTAVRIMLTSRQPFWLGWGPELTYLYNDAYKSIIGGKHPHALGRPFSEVWSEIWDVVGPMADTVMTRNEGTYVESQLLVMERHGYQEETYYTFSYSPVPDDEGGRGGLICANSDDTRRVIGERQLALSSELAARTASARTRAEACELAMQALATADRDLPFAILFTIDGASAAAAASTPDAAALCDAGLWPIERALATGELQYAALDTAAREIPCGAWHRPPSHAAVLPIASSGSSGYAGALVVGLNPLRQFDEGYRGFLELVARQVAAGIANAQAYEQEKQRAESLAELDRAKTAFFSNVSHEFRTPLTLMLGPLDEILASDAAEVLPENRELLTVVHRNGQRLLKLVNTLLDFARIEAGRSRAEYEPTDLATLTTDLASNFRAACERAGIGLDVDCPPLARPAYVDHEMWEKIVLNLVSNAFKFTLQGGIRVALRDSGEGFELVVSDTGTGIPAEALPRMFERFHRVEGARGRSHEGSGIGLALVQELVKLHGGTIAVESVLGKGTTFTVTLPHGSAHLPREHVREPSQRSADARRAGAYVNEALSWLPGAPQSAAEDPAAAPRRHRVLLADDNADLREYAQRLLSQDYAVDAVGDGEAALAAARARRPDIVVSDVMMPRLDGFGLIRALRADPELAGVPVILLSARAGEEARIEGLGRGADDYLVKPFSSRELLVRVAALVHAADAHRKALEARAQFQTLLDRAPLGVYVVDDRFRIAAVNPVAAPVFGDIPDLIGRDFAEVIRILWPQHYAERINTVFRHTLETGEPYYVPEHIGERRDRKVTESYEWQIHRIPLAGERYGVVCYFRDISKSVTAREALRAADRRKDEFIATLSHELRNPLAPLRNALQLLRMGGKADARLEQVQQIMERQVNHLVRLVDDLLEMSRISRGTLELRKERVELASVVRHALETSAPLIEAASHRVEVTLPDAPVWLYGDPVRLSQILSNLLNNAATYTGNGGRISVCARAVADIAVIGVRDNGPGIPHEDLERIFELFSRGERSTSRGQAGLGIGLALTRRLAEMHGGSVEVASEGLGKGSEFTVRLPISAGEPRGAAAAGDSPTRMDAQRVLVVDDNYDAAQTLGMLLSHLGADVRVAHDGAAALEAFAPFDPAVVLLDIGMPHMDGYEVARRLRRDFPASNARLVALTGWGQSEDRRKAAEAGFDHHLVKPAELAQLQALLSSAGPERHER